MFSVYTSSDMIGSPREMYELLKEASKERPVAGNQDGSYLTLKSNYGLIFGVIQLCSGMGTVFLDQGYWQRAIASRPTTAVKAYILVSDSNLDSSVARSTFLHILILRSGRVRLVRYSLWIRNHTGPGCSSPDFQPEVPNIPEPNEYVPNPGRISCSICCANPARKTGSYRSPHHTFYGRNIVLVIRTDRCIIDPNF